jgi:release factor glutamine methyltransferase
LTIQTALQQGAKLLDDAHIPVPRLTAEVLLAHAARHDRAWLYAHSDEELSELWWIHYGRYLHQRLNGTPTQYITRRQEFYGREFAVNQDVLIPRPETEHVVERALELLGGRAGCAIDVGAGSGAIAVTLSLESPARVLGTDISEAALRVAAANNRTLSGRAEFVCCDLLSAIAPRSAALIVSNPPYVPETDQAVLQREVRDHEPHVALFGGPDGFAVYRRLIADAPRVLEPGGAIVMEVAYNAEAPVREMLAAPWSEVALKRDLAGLPRVVSARLPG